MDIKMEMTDKEELFQKLDPKIITSWKISRWIRFGIFAVIMAIPTVILFISEVPKEVMIPTLIIDALILGYLTVTPFLYPAIEYRQWKYSISEDRVLIKHGIFFIQTTIIPVIRIQHVTISQGPIKRKLGISTIQINTASGGFKIEGLSDDNAKSIAESLKNKLLTRLNQQARI